MPKRNNISQAFIQRKVTFQSRYAQKAYDYVYDSASGSLYILGIVLRIVGNEQNAQEVEKIVDDMIAEVESELTGEIARLAKIREDNGLDDVGTSYTNPRTITVQITSPRAARFLHLISMIDELAAHLDCLWLSSILTDQQYSNAGFQWQRRVVRLGHRIRDIATRAIKSARGKGKEVEDKVKAAVEDSGVSVEVGEEEAEADADEQKVAAQA